MSTGNREKESVDFAEPQGRGLGMRAAQSEQSGGPVPRPELLSSLHLI